MQQYLDLCQKVLDKGVRKTNRTGIDTISYIGDMTQFDMDDGFPLLTTKKMPYKTIFGEMLGFLRGYSSAADFRRLGSNVWDANANENEQWLSNRHRKGKDDLGRIYGVQAREWRQHEMSNDSTPIDQLQIVVDKLTQGIDDRRLIVSHWNPSELDEMALPPCHLLYQFGIQDGRLCLTMYQRSCDVALGIPFNIAGYAWLLHVVASITGLTPGVLTHFMHDIHIYVDQVEGILEQLGREPKILPIFAMDSCIETLKDLEKEGLVNQDSFLIAAYDPHPAIYFPMAV